MRTSITVKTVPFGVGVAILLGGMGCASTSDLQKLNQDLNRNLASLNSAVQTKVDTMRTELTKEVKSQAADTKDMLTAFLQKSDQALARIEASNDKRNKQLQQALNQNLESLNATVRSQVATLRTELMKQVESESSGTRKVLTEYAEKRDQALTRIQALNDQLNKQLQSVQRAVAPVVELPSYFAGVNEKMRSIGKALLGNYKGEEAVLRERLKVLEQARKELEPVVKDRGVTAMPSQ